MTRILSVLVTVWILCPLPVRAQEEIVVPFSDPSRAGTISAQLLDGDVVISGYEGNEVRILISAEAIASQDVPQRAQGLRRILSAGFTVEESNNVVRISSGLDGDSDVEIQVPFSTSLMLEVLDGDLVVSNVRGEIDVNVTDGDATLMNVSGPVLAHVLDGDIVGTFVNLVDAPTSLGSLDGDIDLALPNDSAVEITMRSLDGEIYTDFEIDFSTSDEQVDIDPLEIENGSPLGRTLTGTINGGGPQINLQTIDGNIYLRRRN